jgi:hypothetical protein
MAIDKGRLDIGKNLKRKNKKKTNINNLKNMHINIRHKTEKEYYSDSVKKNKDIGLKGKIKFQSNTKEILEQNF